MTHLARAVTWTERQGFSNVPSRGPFPKGGDPVGRNSIVINLLHRNPLNFNQIMRFQKPGQGNPSPLNVSFRPSDDPIRRAFSDPPTRQCPLPQN